ncbi:MAG: hypothetical protein AAGA72_07015 [Pseudomonadota bacterium]
MTHATEQIRLRASHYPNVYEGTSCTRSSFKTSGKAFLFIGKQGGRHKAMFKLKASRQEATQMALEKPKDFQVGSGACVTVRFSEEAPMPTSLWQRWLDESYAISH